MRRVELGNTDSLEICVHASQRDFAQQLAQIVPEIGHLLLRTHRQAKGHGATGAGFAVITPSRIPRSFSIPTGISSWTALMWTAIEYVRSTVFPCCVVR